MDLSYLGPSRRVLKLIVSKQASMKPAKAVLDPSFVGYNMEDGHELLQKMINPCS